MITTAQFIFSQTTKSGKYTAIYCIVISYYLFTRAHSYTFKFQHCTNFLLNIKGIDEALYYFKNSVNEIRRSDYIIII